MDTNGEVLWRVQLVALGDGEAEIIRVAVPGDPGVKQGEMVRVEGMTAQAWEMEGRNGMAFRATRDPLARRARGEGGGVMVRTTVDLRGAGRVHAAPFLSRGRAGGGVGGAGQRPSGGGVRHPGRSARVGRGGDRGGGAGRGDARDRRGAAAAGIYGLGPG